jgi:glucose-1-phosphate cytidylyltransferase
MVSTENSGITAVILAGGLGSRLAEETHLKPKPMVDIGGKPILWHILKIYSFYGINDFVIACGYKGYLIKEYFANYFLHSSDVTFHLTEGCMEVHRQQAEPWTVTLVDTGESTLTGGRLARVRQHIRNDLFCFTYGDGVANVNISALINHHLESGCLATLTAVQPPGRYGALQLAGHRVQSFHEKPAGDNVWINGGFFVLSPQVIDLIEGDHIMWEREPLQALASQGQLSAYRHYGFWQPMDTLRDRNYLEQLWSTGQAPWKLW